MINCTFIRRTIVQYIKAIFENGHYAADEVYFYECNSKKSANLAVRARGASATKFKFFLNHRDL